MNIFENKEDFFGSLESELTDGTLLSLFQLAKQIQNRLGKKAYLLDCYLSIFFEGISNLLASEAVEEGFINNSQLQYYLFDLFEGREEGEKENNLFYKKAKELFHNQTEKLPYQEQHTKVCLLMTLLADNTLVYATDCFVKQQARNLCGIVDEVRMKQLYEQISYVVGESMMEELNLKLKQRFLIAPAANLFAQGMNNDLICRLTMRDEETSKQIFQLFLDSLPQIG